MFDVSREEIIDGSLTRALVVLATPLVVQNLVQVVQQVVDTFWVGRLGTDAVAAVGLNFPVMAFIFTAFGGIYVGTQVLVSQRVGAEDLSGARRAVVHGVALSVALGAVVALAALVGAETVMGAFGAGSEVTRLAAVYLATVMLALPLMGASDALEMGFIGWGDARAALYINVVAVVVNVGLDPFLILGWGPFPDLGVQGAALATAIGYGAGFLLAAAMALSGRRAYRLTRDAASIRLHEFRELLDIGLPTVGQGMAKQTVRIAVLGIVSAVSGAAGLAAYTIGARVASVAFIPASGLGQAAQSVIGQNLGADKPGRAARTTWVGVAIVVVGLSLVATGQWLFPEALTRLLVPDVTPAAMELTVDYLKILALGYWALGATYVFIAGFNGARRTKVSMYTSLLQHWAVRLPIAAVGALVLSYGVHAVFWAVTLSNVAGAVGAGLYYWYTSNNGMLERAAERATGAADG